MTGLELERAVEALAPTCDECRLLHAQLGSAYSGVRTAARVAAHRQNAENLAVCRARRQHLESTRALVRDHLHDTHQMKEAKPS